MTVSVLKPCPLCSGEARVSRRSGMTGTACRSRFYRESVVCKSCGLQTAEAKAPGRAVAAWNRRPEEDRLFGLFKLQTDMHKDHVRSMQKQHATEREVYGEAAQEFKERAEAAEIELSHLRRKLEAYE